MTTLSKLMNVKLSNSSRWLLAWVASRHPVGFARTTRVPSNCPGVEGATIRGLQRRGWLQARGSSGIFYITPDGLAANDVLPDPNDYKRGF